MMTATRTPDREAVPSPSAVALRRALILLFALGLMLLLYRGWVIGMLLLDALTPSGKVLQAYVEAHGSAPGVAYFAVGGLRVVIAAAVAFGAVWLQAGQRWARIPLAVALAADCALYLLIAAEPGMAMTGLISHLNFDAWFAICAVEVLALVLLLHPASHPPAPETPA